MRATLEVTVQVWRQDDGYLRLKMKDHRAEAAEGDDGFFPLHVETPHLDVAMRVVEAEVFFAMYGDELPKGE